MRALARLSALLTCAVGLLVLPALAGANHGTRPSFELRALGHSPNPASFLMEPPGPAPAEVNSDLAFWGRYVFHGDYDGFRIVHVSDGENPDEISRTRCNGTRATSSCGATSWSARGTRRRRRPRTCDGTTVPAGFEGMHIFDISDLEDPVLVGDVELSARPQADSPGCGTHTLTLVPDGTNDRVLIYNATSGGNALLPPGGPGVRLDRHRRGAARRSRRGQPPAPRAARGRPRRARQRRDPRQGQPARASPPAT